MSRLSANEIRLWQRSTPTGQRLYTVQSNERISRTQNAPWDRRIVTGPVSADAETFLSSWTQDDYSGGFGIKDANETSDTSRIDFGVIDPRHPKAMVLPPLTWTPDPPAWAVWEPDELGAALTVWLKADAITGLNDGDDLGDWEDSTGNDNDATEGSDRPTYQTNELNSLPVVRFTSTNDDTLTVADDDIAAYPMTWAFVARQNDGGIGGVILGSGAAQMGFEGSVGGRWTITGGESPPEEYGDVVDSDWHIHVGVFNGASSLASFDGTTTSFTLNSDALATELTIASDGSAFFAPVDIAEIVIIEAAASTSQRQLVEGYLAHKWGLEGNLASDHPYAAQLPYADPPFWPIGDIGTQFYGAWGNGIAGWDGANGAWYTTQNAWPADFVPLAPAVNFCGFTFVPGGAEGIAVIQEATPATGTLDVDNNTDILAVRLGLHDGKLWAIDTANHLWQLTPAGAATNPDVGSSWDEVQDGLGNDLILDTSLSPTKLINWFNPAQEETLWCLTRGQGAYLLNPDEPRWIKSVIKAGAHPDWGIAADVFREGEDLMIAAGGLDMTRETTASVNVPLSGPSKDQGVPPAYQGTIVDLVSERSSLYALIAAGNSVAAGSPTSTWVLQQTVGNQGSATGQFTSPSQVAVDSSGNVYVADRNNNRVQKFDATGAYVGAITGISIPTGVAVDSSGNLYVTHFALGFRLTKYNSSFVSQWTQSFGVDLYHVATNGTHVFVTDSTNDTVYRRLCSTGASVSTIGTTGAGNGQLDTPTGICLDSTHLYVVDRNNKRVQKFLLADGSYVTQWGSAGTDNGEFGAFAQGCAVDASGDVWVCDFSNNRLQRFSNTGTYQTKIAQSSPVGIGVTAGDILWVSSQTHTLAEWDEETVSTAAVAGTAWLGAWTGTAWCALWETTAEIVPTWMVVSMKTPYSLWWGDATGNAYYQLLPPPFFNPAARHTLGEYPYAPTGWMESVRYDANMSGWDKIASHFFAMMDYAAPDTYVDISYRTDADQFDSGLLDPPYRAWKRVDHIGRTLCWFDDTDTDPISGLPYHEGEPFQWIQFRYDFVRGDDLYKSPIWMWHSLHHLSVPQDSASFVFKIPLKDGKTLNREPEEIGTTLRAFQTSRAMVQLQTQNPRPGNPDWQVFFRGRITQVKSEFYAGANNKLDEVLVCTFVEMEASSNQHTTIAVDTPA